MPTAHAVLRTSKADRSRKAPIYLRISDSKGSRFVSLGVKILPSEWNPRAERVRKGVKHSDLINELIRKRLDEVEETILRGKLEGKATTARDIKGSIVNSGEEDFFAFGNRYLTDLSRRGKIGREKRLRATFGKLKEFAGEPLPFQAITHRLISEFETHCVQRGNARSTINTNLKDLKTVINRAEREGVIAPGSNPFKNHTIKAGQPAERTKLSLADINKLEALELERRSLLWHVRNYFLFSFYCAGIRFGDLAKMTAARILEGRDGTPDRLVFRAGKTGKIQSLKITPPARGILEWYLTAGMAADTLLFPMIKENDLVSPEKTYRAVGSANAVVNKYLKKLAERAGIDGNISMHVARHSFADYARKAGWDIYDISKALQHYSIEETERYLKSFDEEALDEAMEGLFGA